MKIYYKFAPSFTESKKIQLKLFKLGYKWNGFDRFKIINNFNVYIHTLNNKIYYNSAPNFNSFKKSILAYINSLNPESDCTFIELNAFSALKLG